MVVLLIVSTNGVLARLYCELYGVNLIVVFGGDLCEYAVDGL